MHIGTHRTHRYTHFMTDQGFNLYDIYIYIYIYIYNLLCIQNVFVYVDQSSSIVAMRSVRAQAAPGLDDSLNMESQATLCKGHAAGPHQHSMGHMA